MMNLPPFYDICRTWATLGWSTAARVCFGSSTLLKDLACSFFSFLESPYAIVPWSHIYRPCISCKIELTILFNHNATHCEIVC